MTDLALILAADGMSADIAYDGDLATDDGLRSAVLMSVGTDARATADDLKRFGRTDENPRGFWADSIAPVKPNDATGSLLWLLGRAKQTEETRRVARDMVQRSLAWMVEDGVAKSVEVTAEWVRQGVLGWRARLQKPDGSRFDVLWQASVLGGQ